MKYAFLSSVGVPAVYALFSLWRRSLRIRVHEADLLEKCRDSGMGIIFAFWHGDLFGVAAVGVERNKRRKIAILTSKSRDGELLTRLLHKLDFDSVRGSSSSGGAGAMLNLKRALKSGRDTALAVDGPRGPRHRVKPGAALLAKSAGAQLLPAAVRYGARLTLKSWDRCEIPLPFSRCDLYFGEPINVPVDADKADMESLREQLEARLLHLKS